MFKRVGAPPKSLYASAPHVADVYSLSCHGADDFADYIKFWRHNGYWLFDSPAIMRALAMEQSISLDGLKLFYYEAHDVQYDEESGTWGSFEPEAHESFTTKVWPPKVRTLEGYDVVTFSVGSAPECSPLSSRSIPSMTLSMMWRRSSPTTSDPSSHHRRHEQAAQCEADDDDVRVPVVVVVEDAISSTHVTSRSSGMRPLAGIVYSRPSRRFWMPFSIPP
jgi:hypothetical protein